MPWSSRVHHSVPHHLILSHGWTLESEGILLRASTQKRNESGPRWRTWRTECEAQETPPEAWLKTQIPSIFLCKVQRQYSTSSLRFPPDQQPLQVRQKAQLMETGMDILTRSNVDRSGSACRAVKSQCQEGSDAVCRRSPPSLRQEAPYLLPTQGPR